MRLIGVLRTRSAAIAAAGVFVAAIGLAVQPLAAKRPATVDMSLSVGDGMPDREEFSWFLARGLYRSTMSTLKMTGTGRFEDIVSHMTPIEPDESTFCLTPEAAPQTQEDWVRSMNEGGCTVDRIDTTNGRIDVAGVCSGEGQLAISGAISSTGVDVMISFTSPPSESGQFTMRLRVESERIGDCA